MDTTDSIKRIKVHSDLGAFVRFHGVPIQSMEPQFLRSRVSWAGNNVPKYSIEHTDPCSRTRTRDIRIKMWLRRK